MISERTQTIPLQAASRFPHLRIGLSPVWVRFLLALVGLALAFGAALFSTVSREAGSVWGTVALASLALLLAVFVGLTTVPYLARRVVASRVREAMDYDVTRAGLIYILISVVIGIAAINTGNNLLYVIVATLLSAIIVSGIASALVLRGLTLDVRLPEHVFAGRPMLARLLLGNTSSWLPSFSVRVVPAKRKKKNAGAGSRKPSAGPVIATPTSNGFACPTASCDGCGKKRTNRFCGSLSIFRFSRRSRNFALISN